MAFTATVYIQGVGVYVPHTDGKKLLVLFPSQVHAKAQGLRDSEGSDWCQHQLVMELDERSLDPAADGGWESQPIAQSFVGFDSDSAIQFSLANDQKLPGLPLIEDFLRQAGHGNAAAVRPSVLDYTEAVALSGALYLQAGALSPDANFTGRWKVAKGQGTVVKDYSSVLKLELGTVSRFNLLTRSFGTTATVTRPLHPVAGELELWIRHFCNVGSKPKPEKAPVVANEPDRDFTLNFALAERVSELAAKDFHPIPRAAESWQKGDPIGDLAHKCMGAQTATRVSFSNPL